ncbi:hypothetical protein ABC337_09210 [Arthrobacter sp. 1P04PC]|uniref:hypothetical protein n=1 Tax=unclassified Arthrobacter TaxID=235627 RepID=UPI0039A27229
MTSIPNPTKVSGRSVAATARQFNGADRPSSSTGMKSMAKVVPIKSVPWLGTRRAGLFRARKLPAKGYPSTTGGP